MPAPSLTGFEHKVVVGIAEMAVSNNQNVTLTTYSLGSCLGIAIYDPVVKAGGLLHIMLPDSSIDSVKAAKQPAMFVDTGVPALFRATYQLRAEKHRMIISVAGGAQIMDSGGFFNIGSRNYDAITKLFKEHSLKIQAEQVGGLVNRTMYLNLATGEVRLKISGQAQGGHPMQELDDYINKVKTLPPAPRILPELLSLLRQDDVDSSRIVKLISFDPAITASVLRLCNSAFFAGASPADDIQEAVTRLGFQQVYQLVAAVSGARLLAPAQKGYGINSGELWQHAVTAAVAAQTIARNRGDEDSVVFTATLLHDIGKLVLAEALEHIYTKLVEDSQSQQAALIETEKRLLGVQHAEIGGRLLSRWNFPAPIVSAVWFHHQPEAAGNDQKLAAYVYLGNMISYFMGFGYGHQAFALRGRAEALEILNLKPEDLPDFMIQTFDKLEMVDALVKVNG